MLVVNVLAGLQAAVSWHIISNPIPPANNSFQKWMDLVGDGSYAFRNLLPYYEKIRTLTAPNTSKRAANSSVTYNPGVFDISPGLTWLLRSPFGWNKV